MRIFATLLLVAAMFSHAAHAATIYATTSTNQLISFDSATPGTITTIGSTGVEFAGIDFRPVNNILYGIGTDSRVYTINTTTGASTTVGAAGVFTLSGNGFGVDFNPVVDRIRVISTSDQNLRINPNDGTLTATDSDLNPGNPTAVGAAYTNNFAGASSTTLYILDSGTDSLYTQNPPNAGTLNLVGALGVNFGTNTGFDVQGGTGIAYAALNSQLYTVNLATGAATLIGSIGVGPGVQVTDIAVTSGIPEPGTMSLLVAGLGLVMLRRKRK